MELETKTDTRFRVMGNATNNVARHARGCKDAMGERKFSWCTEEEADEVARSDSWIAEHGGEVERVTVSYTPVKRYANGEGWTT